jgi:hypothetical protein
VRGIRAQLSHLVENVTYGELVDDPIARILHVVDVGLKVGYTKQPFIVGEGQRSEATLWI